MTKKKTTLLFVMMAVLAGLAILWLRTKEGERQLKKMRKTGQGYIGVARETREALREEVEGLQKRLLAEGCQERNCRSSRAEAAA